MHKTIFITCLLMSCHVFSQEQTNNQELPVIETEMYTSIRPDDGHPAVFPSQEELEAKVADKIDKIKQMIYEQRDNPTAIEGLRKDLWRMENAIVKPN